MEGITPEKFISSAVAVAAWKATVAKACARNQSSLVRVDIISVENATVDALRLPAHSSVAALGSATLQGIVINFKVSYTLQDFKTNNANVTTTSLKNNYINSVATAQFQQEYVVEVASRSSSPEEIKELTETVKPADVVLEQSFVVIETTDRPTYRPSAQPTTGTCALPASFG